jgi:hypothetical protein
VFNYNSKSFKNASDFDTSTSIFAISAPCGWGKTTKLVRKSFELGKTEKVLFAQMTRDSNCETLENFVTPEMADDCSFEIINGDTYEEMVIRTIKARLDPVSDPGVIHCTQAAVFCLGAFYGRHSTHLILDEIPQLVQSITLNLNRDCKALFDCIRAEPYGPHYVKIHVLDHGKLKKIAINKAGQERALKTGVPISREREKLSEVAWILWNSHAWDVWAVASVYENISEQEKITFTAKLRREVFEGWASITIAGARLKKSFFFLEFGDRDFDLIEHIETKDFSNALICYGVNRHWTKNFANKIHDGKSHLQILAEAFEKRVANGNFAWAANKSVGDSPFQSEDAIRLRFVPNGHNDLRDIRNIIYLAATNPTPETIYFYKTVCGFTDEQIRDAIAYEKIYQAMFRGTARGNSPDPILLCVPDLDAAKALSSEMPGSKMEKIPNSIPERVTATEDEEFSKLLNSLVRQNPRSSEWKSPYNGMDSETLRSLDSVKLAKSNTYAFESDSPSNSEISKNLSDLLENLGGATPSTVAVARPEPRGTFYKHIKSQVPIGYLATDSNLDFIPRFHQRSFDTKEEAKMFCNSVMDPEKAEAGFRTRKHIVFVRDIWLDFENGDLTPEDFAEIFPNLQMWIFNSFNHTTENPRFRIVISTTANMTPDEYEKIWDMIRENLRREGFSVGKPTKRFEHLPKSGLDTSKRPPTSLFYLPTQAKDQADSFIIELQGGSRKPLDHRQWLRIYKAPAPKPRRPQTPAKPVSHTLQDKIDAILDEMVSAPKGKGNAAVHDAGIKLKRLGLSGSEASELIKDKVGFMRSPPDRMQDAERVKNTPSRTSPSTPPAEKEADVDLDELLIISVSKFYEQKDFL